MSAALIGVDLGTTGCRSVIFNENLDILGDVYIEYPLINISEREIEQDANQWWNLTKQAIKESVKRTGVDPKVIKGICVSSQGIAFVPVDKDCIPLRNAISWLDTRAVEETRTILGKFDKLHIFKVTGKRINEAYVLPKVIWLKRNEPQNYNRAYKFLMAHDFIIAKLCGALVTDHTMASGTLLYDIKQQDWSREITEAFGLEVNKFPEIKYSGTKVGTVKLDIAQELGLHENVTVSVGGQDQKCSALGAGINDKTFTVSLGTATAIDQICDAPIIDDKMRIPCFSYLFKNKWVLEGVISTSCVSLKWLRNTLFPNKSYKELDSIVEQREDVTGKVFFYPFLGGSSSPCWYENAKGGFYGITLYTSTSEIVKSVMEGIAYQIKSNIKTMEELTGKLKEVRVFGGGAASDVWCQIIADIINKKVITLYTSETASLGAAILAGMGSGVFTNYSEVGHNVKIKNTFTPRIKMVEAYEKKYKEYIELQEKIMR